MTAAQKISDRDDAELLALNAIRGQRIQVARYDEDVKPYDYNLTQATCPPENRPRRRNPFWWASRELWDKPGLMLWLKFGSWGKHIRILPVPKTLPHLHIYVSLPGLTVETAFFRERYEANCLEYIRLSVHFLKWKTEFNLYAPRTK